MGLECKYYPTAESVQLKHNDDNIQLSRNVSRKIMLF